MNAKASMWHGLRLTGDPTWCHFLHEYRYVRFAALTTRLRYRAFGAPYPRSSRSFGPVKSAAPFA